MSTGLKVLNLKLGGVFKFSNTPSLSSHPNITRIPNVRQIIKVFLIFIFLKLIYFLEKCARLVCHLKQIDAGSNPYFFLVDYY